MSTEPRGEKTRVWVSRRVLWIGSDAYPLQNIARTQARQFTFRRAPVWRPWLRAILLWVVLGWGVPLAMSALFNLELPNSAFAYITLAMLALIIISTVRLITALRKPNFKYYSLIIETAGTPRTAMVSTNEDLVCHLAAMIMNAVDDETMAVDQTVMNFAGDAIFQHGNHNRGKVAI